MADPIILQILDALKIRAEAILVSGGYQTNAGARVYVGQRTLDAGDLPCVVIWAQAESQIERYVGGTRARYERRIVAEAVSATEPDAAGRLAEYLKADLHQSLLGPADETLGGLAHALQFESADVGLREEGGRTCGATLVLRVEYFAGHGNPYDLS